MTKKNILYIGLVIIAVISLFAGCKAVNDKDAEGIIVDTPPNYDSTEKQVYMDNNYDINI